MVVRLNTGKSIRGALSYNEYKVGRNKAELILASGFATDIRSLGFTEKLRRFEKLIERRPDVRTNTLHVSLNFHPDEELTAARMQTIARDYMNRIGFASQPYLVYRHKDTKHPHFHIVATNIAANGSYISFHNLIKTKSEPARKAIEETHHLIKAENKKRHEDFLPSAIANLPQTYGKHETKASITNVLGQVIPRYKYTSLLELNLILQPMHVIADRGRENTSMYHNGGLVFSLTDEQGYRTGVPIKASSIYGEPTIKSLNELIDKNTYRKNASIKYTANTVQAAIAKARSLPDINRILASKRILVYNDAEPPLPARTLYFVDHRNKAVFTDRQLGLTHADFLKFDVSQQKHPVQTDLRKSLRTRRKRKRLQKAKFYPLSAPAAIQLINILLRAEGNTASSSPSLPTKKKRRRRPPLQ